VPWHSAFAVQAVQAPVPRQKGEVVYAVWHSEFVEHLTQEPVPRHMGLMENAVRHSEFDPQATQVLVQIGFTREDVWHSALVTQAVHAPDTRQRGKRG
jgi:hypothetical protein